MKNSNWAGITMAILLPSVAVAALTLPYEFSPNTVISSSEINENFSTLENEIEALQDEMAALKDRAGPFMDSREIENTPLLQGNTYIFPVSVTAAQNGKCQVTATLINPSSGNNTSGTIAVHSAMRVEGVETYDSLSAPVINFNELNEARTVAHVYDVSAGIDYEFGCQAFTGQAVSDVIGDLVDCRTTVVCY
jgi:hypothetical protein